MLDVSSENLLHSVFHTIAYSDVFDYPLTAGEVYCYLTSMSASLEEVTQALTDGTLFARVEYYFTLRGRERIVEIRKRRADLPVLFISAYSGQPGLDEVLLHPGTNLLSKPFSIHQFREAVAKLVPDLV